MEDNLEVYFCEICSESVPAKDLETRTARQVKGKVIGACCLADLAPAPGKGGGGAGLTTLGVIFLAALASATVWLEYRFDAQTSSLDDHLTTLSKDVAGQGDMWGSLDSRMDKFADKASITPMGTSINRLEAAVASIRTLVDQLSDSHQGGKLQLQNVDERVGKVHDAQSDTLTRVQSVQADLRRLSQEVAALAAMPRGAVDAKASGREPAAETPAVEEAKKEGLPPALAHQIGRLKDADAGNRFEAVDQLIQSKNPAVREHLLPMLKDEDLFVRRLTAEGLSNYKHKTSVEALIVALADPEGIVRHTAWTSLKKLSGQNIEFEAEGSGSARNAAQRKWKEWWNKAKATF